MTVKFVFNPAFPETVLEEIALTCDMLGAMLSVAVTGRGADTHASIQMDTNAMDGLVQLLDAMAASAREAEEAMCDIRMKLEKKAA
jgi:hypothetical protein